MRGKRTVLIFKMHVHGKLLYLKDSYLFDVEEDEKFDGSH